MKINKKLTPINVAPVKRENVATVSRDGNCQVTPSQYGYSGKGTPFAGDDAE